MMYIYLRSLDRFFFSGASGVLQEKKKKKKTISQIHVYRLFAIHLLQILAVLTVDICHNLQVTGRHSNRYFVMSPFYVTRVLVLSICPPLPFSIHSICLFAPLREDQVPSVWSCEPSCGSLYVELPSGLHNHSELAFRLR